MIGFEMDELFLYGKYMNFVRRVLADETKIPSVGGDYYKVTQFKIEDLNPVSRGKDKYTYEYRVKPIKKIFTYEVASYEVWKDMYFRQKRRAKNLKKLGII